MTPQEMTQMFEGFVPTLYKDTVGKNTIGYGFNIDDPVIRKMLPADVISGKRQIGKDEAGVVFSRLYSRAEVDAKKFVGKDAFSSMRPEVQNILTDMSYNMGYNKLSGFQKFKKALIADDSKKAAAEMKDSKWFDQVGRRSKYHYDTLSKLDTIAAEKHFTWNDITQLAREGKTLL